MLKPHADRALIKPDDLSITKMGIALSSTLHLPALTGEVIEVGKGRLLKNGNYVPMEIYPGDKVMYINYRYSEVEDRDTKEKYLVIQAEDILGVVEWVSLSQQQKESEAGSN